jgi:hypothetical protein
MVRSLPLVSARSSSTFVKLVTNQDGVGCKLLSPAKLAAHSNVPLDPESAEVALGTTEFVFLYCGQFRYPRQVGFLFATALELDRSGDCEASPFDSGSLHRKATLPVQTEPPIAFLARHKLPVPAYRDYMANRLQYLFADPTDYVKPDKHPIRPDPIGLTPNPSTATPDPRLWTFEVRVRNEVVFTPPHLEALFYPARLDREPGVRDFLASLVGLVHLGGIPQEEEGDFAALQRRCLDYLRNKAILP